MTFTSVVLFDRGDYVGFVTRAAVFAEACRKELVRVLTGLEIGRILKEEDLIKHRMDHLIPMMEKKIRNFTRLEGGGWGVRKGGYFDLVSGWVRGKIQTNRVDRYNIALRKLEPLEEIRNVTLHMAEGLSLLYIEEKFPDSRRQFQSVAENLISVLEELATGSHTPPESHPNVYPLLNEEVLLRLRNHQPE